MDAQKLQLLADAIDHPLPPEYREFGIYGNLRVTEEGRLTIADKRLLGFQEEILNGRRKRTLERRLTKTGIIFADPEIQTRYHDGWKPGYPIRQIGWDAVGTALIEANEDKPVESRIVRYFDPNTPPKYFSEAYRLVSFRDELSDFVVEKRGDVARYQRWEVVGVLGINRGILISERETYIRRGEQFLKVYENKLMIRGEDFFQSSK